MVEKLAIKFCEKFAGHRMKLIQIYGDRNIRSSNAGTTDTHLDVFTRILRKYSWRVVVMMSMQQTPILDNFEKDKNLKEDPSRKSWPHTYLIPWIITYVPNTAPGLAEWL